MKRVVVVIPTHKTDPTKNELASFVQCYKILGSHSIRIVAPEGLDVSVYRKAVPDCEFIFIDPHWLRSIEQYNKLKISLYFYNLFKEYEYLLTYELDAWVFRDELEYWCDKGYDYIGALWFEGYIKPISEKVVGVGNSGFSLRNVNKSIKILKRISRLKRLRRFWYRSHLQGILHIEMLTKRLNKVFKFNLKREINYVVFNDHLKQEDGFWSFFVTQAFTDYNVADFEEAFKFSFEVKPSYLFGLNNNRLPFGCHAWEKYEPEFWSLFIPKLKLNNA